MKNIFKIVGMSLLAITIYSCSDSYFDVNTPSNTMSNDVIVMKDVLSPCIQYTMTAQYQASTSLAIVDQHITTIVQDRQGIDNHYLSTLDNYWTTVYTKALPNIKVLEEKSISTNSSHYLAIAKVLKAINIGQTTDIYGDVPYTEATLAGINFTPKYDSQQVIYTDVIKLLDDAIILFASPNTSTLAPGAEDLIYAGNIPKWIKAAYTFKARYQLHLSKVNGAVVTGNAVVESLAKGLTANSEDFQIKYNTVNVNPWYANQLGLFAGNVLYAVSNQFVSYMNGGTVFPFNSVAMDPRMPLLVDMRTYSSAGITGSQPTTAAGYAGTINGTGSGSGSKIGTEFYYSNQSAPIVILGFAEAKFIEAEAQFLINGGSASTTGTNATAYAAYKAGIDANMSKLGVATAAKNAYLADTSIDKGAGALQLKDIMRQKFIALFLNPETFNDYRRYDFSTNAFKGLTIPVNTDPINGGKWIRRFVYSTNERGSNATNYSANFKPMISPVWWDK
jgi:hypothetical protein